MKEQDIDTLDRRKVNFLGVPYISTMVHHKRKNKKNKKIKKGVDFSFSLQYNNSCLTDETETKHNIGVWLSLARAPGLGPGGRRFESCHPDFAGVVQW